MSTRTGIAAARFAELANGLVDELGRPLAEALRVDAVTTVVDEFGLRVEPMAVAESACGVAGRYHEDQQRITYDPTAVARRRSFTVLHELGHAVVYLNDEVADFLETVALDEAEEDLCDAFAAAVLLPDDVVDRHVGKDGPTASDVAALAADSTASREACAVAAAQRLPGSGYVVVARTDGTVQFAARTRTPYRIARDTPQPDDSVLVEAAKEGRARATAAVLRYRSGQPTDPHAADAVLADGYVFGVFTTGRPPWHRGLWIPVDDGPARTDAECTNPACGHEWTAFGRPCTVCRDHRCPECGRCGCDSTEPDETRCDGCGLMVPTGRVVDGRCNDCR